GDVSRRPGDREARRGLHGPDGGSNAGPPNLIPMSAGDLGAAALRAALFLSLWGTGAAIYAAWRRDVRALLSARVAAGVAFGLVVIAALSMMFALATHDFSILYVAENNARETPLFYSIISLWAALEGSILLWTAILAGATAFIAFRGTLAIPRLATTALAVMFAMLTFFLLLITTPAADPFARLAVAPENGNGPNALLQNHPLMALHPPLLYLGYVLTSVPFAYAIASLILGGGGAPLRDASRRLAPLALASLRRLGARPYSPRLSRRDPRPLRRPPPLAVREAPRRGPDRNPSFARGDLPLPERALHGRDSHRPVGDALPTRRGGDLGCPAFDRRSLLRPRRNTCRACAPLSHGDRPAAPVARRLARDARASVHRADCRGGFRRACRTRHRH